MKKNLVSAMAAAMAAAMATTMVISSSVMCVSASSVDYSQLTMASCIFTDRATLVKYAESEGYSVSTSKADGMMIVTCKKKDDANTGFENALGRALAGAIDGFMSDNDFSGMDSIISKFVDSTVFEGSTAKETLMNTLEQGKEGAISGALDAISDNYIIYDYYFSDAASTPDLCIANCLVNGRSDLEDTYMEKYNVDSDGRYIMKSAAAGENYLVDLSQIQQNGMARWVIAYYRQ